MLQRYCSALQATEDQKLDPGTKQSRADKEMHPWSLSGDMLVQAPDQLTAQSWNCLEGPMHSAHSSRTQQEPLPVLPPAQTVSEPPLWSPQAQHEGTRCWLQPRKVRRLQMGSTRLHQ